MKKEPVIIVEVSSQKMEEGSIEYDIGIELVK